MSPWITQDTLDHKACLVDKEGKQGDIGETMNTDNKPEKVEGMAEKTPETKDGVVRSRRHPMPFATKAKPVRGRDKNTDKETKDIGSRALGFCTRHGDYLLAAVFAVLIPQVLFLSSHYDFSDTLAWSVNLVCILLFIFLFVWFYYRRRPVLPGRIIKSLSIFLVVFIIVIIATPVSWVERRPDPNRAKRGACMDNLRTMDSAILLYEAEHGEGVFPLSLEELVPTYLRVMPEEPSGGAYYLDTTTPPPHVVCSEGHSY